eukprot:3463969-Rhodomonas_salina.2
MDLSVLALECQMVSLYKEWYPGTQTGTVGDPDSQWFLKGVPGYYYYASNSLVPVPGYNWSGIEARSDFPFSRLKT